jgi:hypothetical protein
VGPPRPRSSRGCSRFFGLAGALASSAGAGCVAAAVAAWVDPAGFRRRRRRRLREAGFWSSDGSGDVSAAAEAFTASASASASASPSFPLAAPSPAALGLAGRRRDRERDRPWPFFAGPPVDPAVSAVSSGPAVSAPSAVLPPSAPGSAEVFLPAGPRPRPLLPRRRRRVRGRASVDPSSADPARGSAASSVMPRSFPPRRAPSRPQPRGASGVALGDAGLRGHDRHVLAPVGNRPHHGPRWIELGFDREAGTRGLEGPGGSVSGGREHYQQG